MLETVPEIVQGVVCLPNGSAKSQGQKEANPEFIYRGSPFTNLLDSSLHLRALYHIFVVIVLVLLCDTVIYDLIEHGKVNIGESVVGFGDFWRGGMIWILEISIALAFYPGLKIYAATKDILKHFPVLIKIWSIVAVLGVIAFETMIIFIPTWILTKSPLKIFTTVIITCEMFRLAMKMHSAAITCAPRCVDGGGNHPSFKQYTYFLFAPTLIYKDEYPRSDKIRWNVAVYHFLEVAAIICVGVIMWERFTLHYWADYGKDLTIEAGKVARGMFASILPGIIIFLSSFYCVLHSLQNAFAEMLTFGDRLFYEDWWTSSQFSRFYRTWNRLVHMWLRNHIYKPLVPRVGCSISALTVFMISSAAHEAILTLSFRFCYPVLSIQFGCIGLILWPLSASSGRRFPRTLNFIMWLLLFIGNGLLFSLYPMEYFARKNCPPSEADSFFVPKSWSCPEIVFKHNWTFQNTLQ